MCYRVDLDEGEEQSARTGGADEPSRRADRAFADGEDSEGDEQRTGEQDDGVGDADADVEMALGGGELLRGPGAEDHVDDEVGAEEEQVAQRDGRLPAEVDVVRTARIAQMLVADGIRCWAAAGFDDPALADTLAAEISAMLTAAHATTRA